MASFIPRFLRQLRDVVITDVQDGDGITYDADSETWVNSAGGPGGSDDQTAAEVPFTPAGNIAATDVQAAVEELDSEKAAASHAHAGEDITSGTVADARIASTIARDSEVSSAISALASVYQAKDTTLDTYAGIDPSANVQSVLSAADYAAIRSLLGLVIGTNVQAYDADLTTYAGITPSANVQSLLAAANYAAMRVLLDLEAGTDFPSLTTFNDHSARHENGGADELSLAGLDGTPTDLQSHLDDTTDAHDASAISVLDSGAYYTATDVEGVLAEIAPQLGGGSSEASYIPTFLFMGA